MIDRAVNADSSSAKQVREDKEFDWLWHGGEGSLKGRKSVRMFLCCWRGPWGCLVRWMIPRGRMAQRAWVDGVTFPLVPLLGCERD